MNVRCCARHGRIPGVVLALLLALFVVLSAVPVSAGERTAGEVLYAARFADYTSLRDTGIRFGTSSGGESAMDLVDGELLVSAVNGEKTYILLPEPLAYTDTYTLRFSFRFAEVSSANGYCGLLLSSRGDAPSGRMELIVRASGAVDGYGEASASFAEEAARGEAIQVTVQVRYGFLTSVVAECGGERLSYTPAELKTVRSGGRGFVVRNASVAFSAVEVIHGTEFTALSGEYAEHSYVAPEQWTPEVDLSPDTGEIPGRMRFSVAALLAAAAAWLLYRARRVCA